MAGELVNKLSISPNLLQREAEEWFKVEYDISVGAWEYLSTYKQSSWSKSGFSDWPKVDNVTNNNAESFNTTIVDMKEKSILTVLEEMRFYIMRVMAQYKDTLSSYTGKTKSCLPFIVGTEKTTSLS
ncbi:hypothetical protein Ahy_B01g056573 [Arachis hypogaea]|uniref:Uncharacterized protein n=1 Tax=Arachis hypogaea TaxID=3818 RepID=A0A445AZ43_ARAHY|nr:hypothetical protein Ahy_B01g056573 [Arachis hypogaea]